MFLTAIVAMDRKGLIGANGKIPWHLPSDLKRFRRLTIGKPVIMGRKTWESLPGPLEGRKNIVVSGNYDYAATAKIRDDPHVAVGLAGDEGFEASVIGGASIYGELIGECHRICLTVVDGDFEGDTYFPLHMLNGRHWKVASEKHPDMNPMDLVYLHEPRESHPSHYYELVEKRQPGEGVHEIWHWVDRKAYEEATGR